MGIPYIDCSKEQTQRDRQADSSVLSSCLGKGQGGQAGDSKVLGSLQEEIGLGRVSTPVTTVQGHGLTPVQEARPATGSHGRKGLAKDTQEREDDCRQASDVCTYVNDTI